MLYDLHLFQRVYDFLLWIKPTVQRFTKVHKYSLGVQLENEVIELLKEIIRANFQKGIDFLGYRIFEKYRLLRKSTVRRFIKRTKFYQKRLAQRSMSQKEFDQSLQSWNAYAKHGNSWRLRKDLEGKLKVNLIK